MDKIKREDWIKVSERLPHDNQLCLITDGHNIGLAQWDEWPENSDIGGWWDCAGGGGYEFEWTFDPTHWTPLGAELP